MATPSVKELQLKLTKIIEEKNNIEKKLNLQITTLQKELNSAKRGMAMYSTEDSIKRKILELRARNHSPIKIVDTCRYIGMDVELEVIKNIVNNISELDSELKLYYAKCCEDYEKEIKINPQILKQSSLEDVQFQIDQMKEIIARTNEGGGDDLLISKYMDKLDVYIKTRATIVKDTSIIEEEVSGNENVNKIKDSLNRRNKNIIEGFDPTKFKAVK